MTTATTQQKRDLPDPQTRAAFQATQAERDALKPAVLKKQSLNINVPGAVDIVRGCVPKIAKLRPLVAQLPFFDMRHFDQLKLRESEEMKTDRAYLDQLAAELTAESLTVSTELAMGDPATELIRLCKERKVDLIAMSTHGHRFLQDLLRGTTVDEVRHLVTIPVLLLRAQ